MQRPFVRIHFYFSAKRQAHGGTCMQGGDQPKLDEVINEIAALLAEAYRRRARIRLVQATPGPLPPTEGLANADETSLHELRLTTEKKEWIPR